MQVVKLNSFLQTPGKAVTKMTPKLGHHVKRSLSGTTKRTFSIALGDDDSSDDDDAVMSVRIHNTPVKAVRVLVSPNSLRFGKH